MKRRDFLLTGSALLLQGALSSCALSPSQTLMGTGDLAVIIARADGKVAIVNTTHNRVLGFVDGLGDLSHASAVFSRDERYCYIFGRDGGLTQVDVLQRNIKNRVIQAGNSIGGAISQDGRYIAVSNYTPGGVNIFDSETLEKRFSIDTGSKTVGLVDAPNQRFVFSLWDKDEIWLCDLHSGTPVIQKFSGIGKKPYDALISQDGRHYIAGLFGEDGLAHLDLWHTDKGVQRILPNYGKGEQRLPVFKMPHLEGWAMAGDRAFLPAIGRHEVLVVDRNEWKEVGRIPVVGQPVFVMARPDSRQIWVSFAHPDNGHVQVFDSESLAPLAHLQPGPAVLHMEFTPRGEHVWLSVRDNHEVQVVSTRTFNTLNTLKVPNPSGIFMSARAHRIGL